MFICVVMILNWPIVVVFLNWIVVVGGSFVPLPVSPGSVVDSAAYIVGIV